MCSCFFLSRVQQLQKELEIQRTNGTDETEIQNHSILNHLDNTNAFLQYARERRTGTKYNQMKEYVC